MFGGRILSQTHLSETEIVMRNGVLRIVLDQACEIALGRCVITALQRNDTV